MHDDDRRERLRSFLVGGVIGASAALAAMRRSRPGSRQAPAGLDAFEGAPCFQETLEHEVARPTAARHRSAR